MAARILSGNEVAEQIRNELKQKVKELKARKGVTPGLAVVLVGENPASVVYVRSKARACEELGIRSRVHALDPAAGPAAKHGLTKMMAALKARGVAAEQVDTLAAAQGGWGRPLVAVFQPHLYSRTRDLCEGFARSLMAADTALVLPIYPAREAPIAGVSSRAIVSAARKMGHRRIYYLKERSQVAERVADLARRGDMVLTIGAGDVHRLAPMILRRLREGTDSDG
jgi:hypothetical protein